jgi:hypothetical protein
MLETTGTYSTATSILAGRFQQMAGASTIVDGVFRTRERGAILNDGLILVSGGGALENGNYVLNQSGGTIKVLEGASLTQGPQGYLRGRLENEGRLEVEGTMTGGDLVTTGRLIVASGGVLGTDSLFIKGGHASVQGSVASLVFMSSGLLDGTGVINGDLLFISGGGPMFDGPCASAPAGTVCFTPGNSPGSMTIDGLLTLGSNAVMELEITRDTSGALAFDTVTAAGMRFEAGSFVRLLLDPSVGFLGSPLALLTCTDPTLECTFDANFSVVGGTADFEFQPGGLAVLNVTAVPEPSTVGLMLAELAVTAGAISRRRRGVPAAGARARSTAPPLQRRH